MHNNNSKQRDQERCYTITVFQCWIYHCAYVCLSTGPRGALGNI